MHFFSSLKKKRKKDATSTSKAKYFEHFSLNVQIVKDHNFQFSIWNNICRISLWNNIYRMGKSARGRGRNVSKTKRGWFYQNCHLFSNSLILFLELCNSSILFLKCNSNSISYHLPWSVWGLVRYPFRYLSHLPIERNRS